MSWIKRRGQTTPSPNTVPPVQMYNPNQHSMQENQWQQQPQNYYNQPQQQFQPKVEPQTQTQNYWQQPYNNQPQPPAPYNQNAPQYGQYQEQTGYFNNTGYQQQQPLPPPQQPLRNMQFNQQYNQNNVYHNPTQPQQAQTQPAGEGGDSWNWGWGDEDNSNNVQALHQQNATTANTNQAANNIDERFTNDTTWNWSLEDAAAAQSQNDPKLENALAESHEEQFPKVGKVPKHQLDLEVNKSIVQDRLAVAGKRGKLETPQWSVESQMSQESSDDVLHTSESDKSHMLSRSSTISHSPISGHESLPANHHNLEDVAIKTEVHSFEDYPTNSQQFENKEILSNIKRELPESSRNLTVTSTPPPPPQNTRNTPPLLPPQVPPTIPTSEDSGNPFKRPTGLSHKSASKFRGSNVTPPETRPNVYQPFNNHQSVNLETLPDNSEQPDSFPSAAGVGKLNSGKSLQQWPDNNEAPINDRNQYLETGQLSDANLDFTQHGDKQESVVDTLPPPGLRRMVLGQMEQNEGSQGNSAQFGDEPPPGLSRMVLGQTESVPSPPVASQLTDTRYAYGYGSAEPPEGFHRMVPGESSSPESTLRHQSQTLREENISEPEFEQLASHTPQPRSATIGADTPPAVLLNPIGSQSNTTALDRSETIGGDNIPVSTSQDNRVGANGNSTVKKGDSKKQEVPSKALGGNRREFMEGQTQHNEVSNLTNSIRNLTVGENLTDGHTSNTSIPEVGARRHSRQESTDSERELKKAPRNRDKRSLEKAKQRELERGKQKERDYSPEHYNNKDKKYESSRRRYKDSRRYEEDTDFTSDKEKERRSRDDRDYDRKYNSLRKDKDKERRRRDPREYDRDPRKGDYYYGRYEDYEKENRGSRSTSPFLEVGNRWGGQKRDHKDRRERERERDRYRRHRGEPRDMYNPYQSVAYDPYNPYYQQYQYYENLRRTNPQAYAEWYRKYYQQAGGQAASSYGGGEDRASVHSGRSSANDELSKDRYTRQSYYSQASLPHLGGYYGDTHSISGQYGLDHSSFARPFDQTDSSLNLEDNHHHVADQRLTPAKFATTHIKGSIGSGKLLKILPNYQDGQNSKVEIINFQSFLTKDKHYEELNRFPGPLVKGTTHKNTIIDYCEMKICKAAFLNEFSFDIDNYILLWELLILLIRQNGMVVGTDIAELLLNKSKAGGRTTSVLSSASSNAVDAESEDSHERTSEAKGSFNTMSKEGDATNKFRDYLLYGSGKEALEWAMKNGLWGHALFLASKLDKRTYANVMMRFANGLTLNDPLQTLYQLLSGKMPAAVTCVSDSKWGDWRPHLAMILSNSTQRPELNCKAIMTLGDTLFNRGSIFGAQFCYLMAEERFGRHGDPESKLVLLGANHTNPLVEFATNDAIHMTEIYEYACSLNDSNFAIPEFQVYKYLKATRLADRGLLEKSLLYLEKLANYIIHNPSAVEATLVDNVYTLADKLKFCDPVGDAEDESEFGGLLETNRPDNSWLKDLRAIQNDFQAGLITHQNLGSYTNSNVENDGNLPEVYEATNLDAWQQQQQQFEPQYQQTGAQPWQPEQQQVAQAEYQQNAQQQNDYSTTQYGDQQQPQQQYWGQQEQSQQWGDQSNLYNPEMVDPQQSYYGTNAQSEPKEVQKDPSEMSRWSSASSLSREVQFYMRQKPHRR